MSRVVTFGDRNGQNGRIIRLFTKNEKYNGVLGIFIHPKHTFRNFVFTGTFCELSYPGNALITLIFSLYIVYFLEKTVKEYEPYCVPRWILKIVDTLPNWIKKTRISSDNFSISLYDSRLKLKKGSLLQLFHASFSHNDLIHLVANMIGLITYGPTLLSRINPIWFSAIYCLSGIGSAILHTKMKPDEHALGASGCIYGLYGAIEAMDNTSLNLFIIGRFFGTIGTLLFVRITKYPISAYGHLGGAIMGYFAMSVILNISVTV